MYIPLTPLSQAHCAGVSVVNVMVNVVVFMLDNRLVNDTGRNQRTPARVVEGALGIDRGNGGQASFMNMW